MGVRAVIETLMTNKIGDQGSFSKNLSEFSKRGFISEPQRLAMEQAIDVGSAAIHRGAKAIVPRRWRRSRVTENVIEGVDDSA